MPIRNPFAKRPQGADAQDENLRPDASAGFERVDTVGSKASSVLSIRTSRSQDTGDYKMSGEYDLRNMSRGQPCVGPFPMHHKLILATITVVNDSGVYLPVCFDKSYALLLPKNQSMVLTMVE